MIHVGFVVHVGFVLMVAVITNDDFEESIDKKGISHSLVQL